MSFKTFAVAALAAAAIATPAAAVTSMDGTFAASFIGLSSDTPSIGAGSVITNTVFTIVGSVTGDFTSPSGAGSSLSPSSFTATNGSVFSFTSAIGNFSGTVSNVVVGGPTSNRVLSAYALGSFSPLGIYSAFIAGPASVTLSFTQNNAEGAISGGFTLSTPPAPTPGIPEPAAWALLIAGFGLTGAAMRRRRATVAA